MRPQQQRRAALYCRVSLKDEGQDVRNQLIQLREFCRNRKYRIVAEFVDQKSGKDENRSQFQKMFEAARRGEFDVLIFWALDRFSRQGTVETLNHLQRLTQYGVDWQSHQEQYVDSCGPFRDAVIGILAAVAAQERNRISERTLLGLQRARAEGKTLGRPAVDVDLKQARAMRRKGSSLREIASAVGVSPATVMHRLAQ